MGLDPVCAFCAKYLDVSEIIPIFATETIKPIKTNDYGKTDRKGD